MRHPVKSVLPAMIAMILATAGAQAQDPDQSASKDQAPPKVKAKPGLYTTVDRDEIYIIQGGKQLDLKTGEAAYASKEGMHYLSKPPAFLNWPCGTSFAPNQGTFPAYSLDDLPAQGRLKEVIRRYFDVPEIPEKQVRFLTGDYNARFPASEIEPYLSDAYWYESGPAMAKLAARRPRTLIISLYPGTKQVIVDKNHFEELKAYYGDQPIPVDFEFQPENVVPISDYGAHPDLKKMLADYIENGKKPAEVPMWFAGDHHLEMTPEQLEKLTDIPALDSISADRQAELKQDIENLGFERKPITIAFLAGSDRLVIDEGERVRVAASMGIKEIPVMLTFYNATSHTEVCGLAPPVAAVATAGSNSSVTPPKPPEIELPDPPQVEPPASGS